MRKQQQRTKLTFLANNLYLSALSLFQQPLKYSNRVSPTGKAAKTVIISGSSVESIEEGDKDNLDNNNRSTKSVVNFIGFSITSCGQMLISLNVPGRGREGRENLLGSSSSISNETSFK